VRLTKPFTVLLHGSCRQPKYHGWQFWI